jgi:NDP-sugar pyrophosphorylase family protein
MQVIIPMSGQGKRFKDKGYELPKPFIQISGRPMVQHVVEMFPGVEDVLFIVNRDHFEDKTLELKGRLLSIAPAAEIVVIDSHNFGPAWAILQARDSIKLDVPVVVNYCDFACTWNFSAFREQLHSGVDGLIATYSGFHPHMLRNTQYAYLKLDEKGNLLQIQEKLSFSAEPMKEPASSGTYGFGSGQILIDAVSAQIAANVSYNNEFYSSLTYVNMIQSGRVIKNFEIEKFFQWGTPEDFEDFKWQKDFFTFKKSADFNRLSANRVEVLAAGEGKRFANLGYKTSKPFLTMDKGFLLLEALNSLGKPTGSKGILLRENQMIPPEQSDILDSNQISVRRVKNLTRGQAESALLSLSAEVKGSCIIATCDSLVFPELKTKLSTQEKTLGVWITKPSKFAIEHPQQFGWVKLNSEGEIIKSWVKISPETFDGTYLITGTFFFGNDIEGTRLLESFLLTENIVNSEFYLDSVLAFADDQGWKVLGLIPDWFVSLGTPDEYETYRYWESLFSSRPDLLVEDE